MPSRIQRKRTKGWRMPDDAIYVGRPAKWGNPFPVDGAWATWTAIALGYRGDAEGRRFAAVALHHAWLTGRPVDGRPSSDGGAAIEFSDGTVRTFDEHCRGMTALAAAISEQPVIPIPPPLDEVRVLAGCDLVCWCPADVACHADVLLELANGTAGSGEGVMP